MESAAPALENPPEDMWGPPPNVLHFESVEEFEKVRKIMHGALLKTFHRYPYNTLDSLVDFHKSYRSQRDMSLEDFNIACPVTYDDQTPSCVLLNYKVMDCIAESRSDLRNHFFLAECNDYDDETPVPSHPPSPEVAILHDHLLVALEFSLEEGRRRGYILADAGLVLGVPIVIMRDGLPPHTGIFYHRGRSGRRENVMQFQHPDDLYAVWTAEEIMEDQRRVSMRTRFVYLNRPFLLPDELERRNRVHTFHGYLLMKEEGVGAGLYIVMGKDNRRFTLFIPDGNGKMKSLYLSYGYFVDKRTESGSDDNEAVDTALDTFAQMCGFQSREDVVNRFRPLSRACLDSDFIDELVVVHQKYVKMLQSACLHTSQTLLSNQPQ